MHINGKLRYREPSYHDETSQAPPHGRPVVPVFVLCGARSGSTLLRFILDSHPDLACPPEIAPGRACASLAHMTDALLDRDLKPRTREADQAAAIELDAQTATLVHDAISLPYNQYLARRRKRRWCDKSLDNALFAPLLSQVFPNAQFLCLYRQCMDVIDSGIEASPWGLSSFGFGVHSAQFPGNSVAAIGHYWLTTTRAILEFEASQPQRCMRIRYEDLVLAPEEIGNAVFSFLGEQPVQGIAKLCLSVEHESHGPGDQKIWFTDRVDAASVGRGERVPVEALPPPLREEIDRALAALGYDAVGIAAGDPGAAERLEGVSAAKRAAVAKTLAVRLHQATQEQRADVLRRWPPLADLEVEIRVGETLRQSATTVWRFASDGDAQPGGGSGGQTAMSRLRIVAGSGTWQALLSGETNMAIELVSGRVRLDREDERSLLREPAVLGLCVLLGISGVRCMPAGNVVGDAQASAIPATEGSRQVPIGHNA